MFVAIKMPKLSDTSDYYKITKIYAKVGDIAVKGEPFMEVETDKSTMPVAFYNNGKITEITAKEGDTVRYCSMLGVIDEVEE